MGILDLLSTGNQYADPNGLYAGLMGHKGIAGYFENASNPAAMATQRPPQDGWEPGGQYPQGMPNSPPAAAAPHKPGFFGRGGAAWGILGSLSDAAAVAGGGQPYFGEDIRRQREKRMDRQNVMDQWVAEQQWKDAHPDPTNFQREADYAESQIPGSRQQFIQNHVDPYKGIQTVDGDGRPSISLYRPSQMGGQPSTGPNQAHIGALQAHPERAAEFDARFGPGAAARYLGGAGQGGPRTFRPGY